MKQKMVIPHAAGDDLFHVIRETNRQSDFSILFFFEFEHNVVCSLSITGTYD